MPGRRPRPERIPRVDTGRLAGDNTIGTSRLLCIGALILVLGALGRSRWRLPAAALAAGFIAVAAAVGSRGPILSFGFALAVTLTAWLLRAPRKVAPVLAIAAVERRGCAFRLAAGDLEPAALRGRSRSRRRVPGGRPLLPGPAGLPAHRPRSDPRRRRRGVQHGRTRRPSGRTTCSSSCGPSSASRRCWWSRRRSSRRSWGSSASRGDCPGHEREQELVYILLAVFVFNLLAVQVSGNINDNRDFWGMLAIASLVVAGRLGDA